MIQQYCTVCGALLEEPHEFESRTYCDTHYNRFSLDVPGVWRAVSVSVLTLFVQSVAIALLALVLPPLESGPLRLGFGLIVATFPAAVWLIVMLQTTQSNRVSSLLVTIFVLAALAAAAFTRPFLNEFIGLAEWLTRTTVIYRFLGNILVAGMTHAFLVFAIIRFTVWMNPVFERRVDGVMYGAAAGWGYATAINILFVLD
ncbi:MAG: hypothetical protein GYB64_16830 [Chloroflexi bacterium]|nr:hypothetical protein [Chloroflexota bacterium]